VPGNNKADALAGQEAEKVASSPVVSLTSLKALIAKKYNVAKEKWYKDPSRRGKDSIPPPPPKKSCLDGAKKGLASVVAQIRTGHWRSATYFKRIRKRENDHCWLCRNRLQKMSRSHVLLHCPKLEADRAQAWGSVRPKSIRVLLASPRWESRLVYFLELSGAGRVMENGRDEKADRASRLDGWIVWDHRDREPD
jgi:hypothetical protein